jgi:hypothetical protein
MAKQQLCAEMEKELAARHCGMRFPEVLRFYVDQKNVRTGVTNWWDDHSAIEKGKANTSVLLQPLKTEFQMMCFSRLAMM